MLRIVLKGKSLDPDAAVVLERLIADVRARFVAGDVAGGLALLAAAAKDLEDVEFTVDTVFDQDEE